MSNTYSLRGGDAAVERLELLAEAKWPSTQPLLARVGLTAGMRVLDLGCGIGEVSRKIAKIVGPEGYVLGVDRDETAISIARQRVQSVEFAVGDATTLQLGELFDLVYIRYLLCHVSDPHAVLKSAKAVLKPGGILVVEDTDFDGHICYPRCAAFDEYLRLFKCVVHLNGGDACIGPRLPGLLKAAGFSEVGVDVVTPLFDRGEGKMVGPITLRHVRESLLAKGLATTEELDSLEEALNLHCLREDTLVSLARTFQAWGSVS